MVNIVNYEAPGAGSSVAAGNGGNYVTVDYGSIAGLFCHGRCIPCAHAAGMWSVR